MKKHLAVLLGVLLIGAGLACWSFLPHSDTSNDTLVMQRDSLQKGEAVLWPEQHAYFRIHEGHWEKSKDIFDSPFVPVATEEASDMLNTHFNLNPNKLVTTSEVKNETNVTSLINVYDSLDRIGKQHYENKLYPLAKQTFQQALEIANNIDKLANTEFTKNRINEVNAWITKCEEASKSNDIPIAEKEAKLKAEKEAKRKPEDSKRKPEEAKLKEEDEAKLKAEEVKKRANTADEEWDKITLSRNRDGQLVVSKEKAIEIWNGLKNKQEPKEPLNKTKWKIVRMAKK